VSLDRSKVLALAARYDLSFPANYGIRYRITNISSQMYTQILATNNDIIKPVERANAD
jgi:hypothetical protein